MKIIYLLIYIIFVVSSTSCSEENDKQGILTYYYDETQCADPWERGQTKDEKKLNWKYF